MEAELKRLMGVEAKIHQDLDQQLAEQKEELKAKHRQEVEELCTA
jgi:hypothetical protein